MVMRSRVVVFPHCGDIAAALLLNRRSWVLGPHMRLHSHALQLLRLSSKVDGWMASSGRGSGTMCQMMMRKKEIRSDITPDPGGHRPQRACAQGQTYDAIAFLPFTVETCVHICMHKEAAFYICMCTMHASRCMQ